MIHDTVCVWDPQVYRVHGMKFQAVTVPDGMIAHLPGPYHAPQNDTRVLAESHLFELMREHTIQPGSVEGDPPEHRHFQLYCNSAYAVSAVLVSPHTLVGVLIAVEHAWNTGEVWISIEHALGIALWDWPFLCSSWKHQVFGTACGCWYRAVVLLANAHNCFVPNQTAQRYTVSNKTVRMFGKFGLCI